MNLYGVFSAAMSTPKLRLPAFAAALVALAVLFAYDGPSVAAQQGADTAQPPGAPTRVTVATDIAEATPGTGLMQVEVSWTAPSADPARSAVTGYDLEYKATNDSGWVAWSHPGMAVTAVITGLAHGMEHQVRVRAKSDAGAGEWSASAAGTPQGKPYKPETPKVTPSDEQLTVTWTTPNDGGSAITGNRVQIWESGTVDDKLAIDIGGEATSYTIDGLNNHTAYEVEVAAFNKHGVGEFSDVVEGTPVRLPGPPLDMEVVQGIGSVEVGWREPEDNGGLALTGYRVRWRDAAGEEDAWQPSAEGVTLEETAIIHQITGLERSHYPRRGNGYLPLVRKSYLIEVAADTASGPGDWASRNSAELQGVSAPGEPPNPSVSRDGDLVVTWGIPSNAGGRVRAPYDSRATNLPPDPKVAGFYVRWREAAGDSQAGPWQRADGNSDLGQLVDRCTERTTGHTAYGPTIERNCTTTYTITGLEKDRAYDVQVRTLNDIGVVSAWAEPPPVLFLTAVTGGEVPEAGQSVQVTAKLNKPASAGGVEVTLAPRPDDPGTAKPDIDYSLPAAFTIAEGEREGSAIVTIHDDAVNEADETINLTASTNSAGAVEVIGATVVIEDDESYITPPGGQWNKWGMLVTNVRVVSEYRSLTFTFGPNPYYHSRHSSFWLQWRADDNPEWTTVQGISSPYTLNLPKGSNDILHHIRLIAVGDVSHGWVTVTATPALQGPIPQGPNEITLSAVSPNVAENAGRLKVRAALYDPAPAGGATVELTATGGDAVLDTDYSLPAVVEIAEGFRQGSAFLTIINNAVNEAHKTINLAGSASTGAVTTTPLTITIQDDEPDYGDPEGSRWMQAPRNLSITPGDGTLQVEFDPSGDAWEYWLQWRADDNPLWTTIRGGYIGKGGRTHQSDWTISGLANGKLHHVRVANTKGQGQPGLRTWSGWVTSQGAPNEPGTLTLRVDNQAVNEDAGTVTVTASAVLDSPASAGGVKVTLTAGEDGAAAAGEDFTLPDTFALTHANPVRTAEIVIINDRIDEDDETIVLKASANPSLTATGTTLTISDDDTAGVTITAEPPLAVTEAEGDGHTAAYTVVLESQPTADVTITPTSGDPTAASVSAALTFGPENWAEPQTVTVTAVNDDDKEHETLDITHSVTSSDPNYNGISPSNNIVGVNTTDDDLPTLVWAYGRYTTTEQDGNFIFRPRVWIRNASPGENSFYIPMQITSESTATRSWDTCVKGSDYLYVSQQFSFNYAFKGTEMFMGVRFTICGDDVEESDETVIFQILPQPNSYTILETGKTVVTIKDDDSGGGL